MDEPILVMRLRQVEAELAPGLVRVADGPAPDPRARVVARREASELTDPPMEHHFRVPEPAQRRLLTALLRRYGLTPYRYPRQTEVDVMVRMSIAFEAELFDPIHRAMKAELARFVEAAVERVAAEALHWDSSDAGESVDDVPRSIRRP